MSEPEATPSSPKPAAPNSQPPIIAPPPKRRRWLRYVLISLGALVSLAILVAIGIAVYFNHLVKTYTATKPLTLPSVELAPDAYESLVLRYTKFRADLEDRKATAPFIVSATDLNALIGKNPKAKEILCFQITNNQIQALFTVPTDEIGFLKQKHVKGRYLNGVVTFKLTFENGFLDLYVKGLTANDQTPPSWIVKQFKKKNLLGGLDKDHATLELLQELDDVTITNNLITFLPLKKP